jgi:hypothetical protein
MSSIDRKLKRKREREQAKKAKKGLRDAIAAMNSLPPGCTECGAGFDLARDADGWRSKAVYSFCAKNAHCLPHRQSN